jgi:hypothetical protein
MTVVLEGREREKRQSQYLKEYHSRIFPKHTSIHRSMKSYETVNTNQDKQKENLT